MKKNLLLFAGIMMAATAFAQTEVGETYGSVTFTNMSPSGEWVSGTDMEWNTLFLLNTKTRELQMNEIGTGLVGLGSGNAVSDNGIVLFTTEVDGDASYYENGEIKTLPFPEELTGAFPNGISSDGSRICGTIGFSFSMDTEDKIMQTPVIWNRNVDGTYGDPVSLPYPTQDWSGAKPQYVMATCISGDGKRIVGQIEDNMGSLTQLVMWTEKENGEWEYAEVQPQLINPNKVEIPENPGDGPESPQYEDYMTETEAAAYQAALEAWYESGYQEELYPNPANFMTPNEIDDYNAAVDAYNELAEAFNEKYEAYMDAVAEAIDASPNYELNCIYLSTNGRYLATLNDKNDFWSTDGDYFPCIFDLETGEYVFRADANELKVRPTKVRDNGSLLGATPGNEFSRNTVYCSEPKGFFFTIQDLLETGQPETYAWMVENMKHDIKSYDYEYNPETDEWEEVITVEENQWRTGTAVCSDDLSVFASFTSNDFDESIDDFAISYVYYTPDLLSGVGTLKADKKQLTVKMDKSGVVTINGDAKALNIYDVNGRVVFSANEPAATVATGLKAGVYVIKVEGRTAGNVVAKSII